jgi:hypothetical protein
MNSPTIKATFELDEKGRPAVIRAGDVEHYRIKLNIDGAPPDTYAVTYVLDPSYHAPVREVRSRDNSFEERLTSYGDYTVQAKIRTRGGITTVAVPLSRALQLSYGDERGVEINAALQNIIAR